MKLSVKDIKSLVDFEIPPVDRLVDVIGSKLGQVEEVIDLSSKYKDVLIVKVIEAVPIKESDHLSACLIDDGHVVKDIERNQDGYIPVVCGAPNVRADMMSVYLPPETVVPSSLKDKEPFVLKVKPILGHNSNGMLASEKELDLSDDHEGIVEIDGSFPAGTFFAKAFELDDQIIEIENKMFTHRPDCFGQIGLARELGGILGHSFTSPGWYINEQNWLAKAEDNSLKSINQSTDLVPAFNVSLIHGIKVGPSPLWLKIKLARFGIRSINNIVDVTNYIMMLTAQPLHAYDYNKLKNLSSGSDVSLVARLSKKDEKLVLLNGKEITLEQDMIVIATDDKPVGLAGVMGGLNSMIDENTTSIVLEAASFDMYKIKRTSMIYGLFSDAVTRFTKGQSPYQVNYVLSYAVRLIAETSTMSNQPAIYVGNEVDKIHANPELKVSVGSVNSLLGTKLSADAMKQLLTNVEFSVSVNGDDLMIKAPYWRTDIHIWQDVAEEIGRLWGYDLINKVRLNRDALPVMDNPELDLNTDIRQFLSTRGASEVLTYSFVPQRLIDAFSSDSNHLYAVKNALSPDLKYYRSNIISSLLDRVNSNIRSSHDNFALYEIGRVHSIGLGLSDVFEVPDFKIHLSFVYAMSDKMSKKINGSAYYWSKKYLDGLFDHYNVKEKVSYRPLSQLDIDIWDDLAQGLLSSRSAVVYLDDSPIGLIGEFNQKTSYSFKLPRFVSGFEIDLQSLTNLSSESRYTSLSRFPSIDRDYCYAVSEEKTYSDVVSSLSKALSETLSPSILSEVSLVDIFSKPESNLKHFTFRVVYTDFDKTLSDKIINEISSLIESKMSNSLGATLV